MQPSLISVLLQTGKHEPKSCRFEEKCHVHSDDLVSVLKVTGMSEEQLLVTVLPGFPTTAEIFIVPEKRAKHGSVAERRAHLDQVGGCRESTTGFL